MQYADKRHIIQSQLREMSSLFPEIKTKIYKPLVADIGKKKRVAVNNRNPKSVYLPKNA